MTGPDARRPRPLCRRVRFLRRKRYLIHDRDPLFTDAFRAVLRAAGIECLKLPARSPNLGTGWSDFKEVFSGGDGVIYAVNSDDELLWYRHDGRANGSRTWAPGSGSVVSSG